MVVTERGNGRLWRRAVASTALALAAPTMTTGNVIGLVLPDGRKVRVRFE